MTARHAVFRNGQVHVLSEQCPTCIFRAGNLMRLRPGRVRQMVDEAKRLDTCIVCHMTTSNRKPAVCFGFFELRATTPLQIADRLGFITFVDVPL